MKDRIKEIDYEIFQQCVTINNAKKRIKQLQIEKEDLLGQQRLEKVKKLIKRKPNER